MDLGLRDKVVLVTGAGQGFGRAVGLAFEAGEPALDVRRVIRLALLAVVHDVEPGGELLSDDVLDRGPDASVECLPIRDATALVLLEQLEQVVRARQAADVRRTDARGHLPSTFPQSVILPLKSAHAGYFMNSSGVHVQNCDTFG